MRVDEDLTGSDQLDPRSGYDASGHGLVVWTDFRSASSGADILGRAFSFTPTYAENPPPDPPPPGPPSTPAPPAPRAPRIGPARPNPFSSVTSAPIETPGAPLPARVTVWNARGERVATLWDGGTPAERFTLRWDGRDDHGRAVASGIYWITVESGGVRRGTRVVHLR
jgi:hypothetical protein